MKKRLFAMLMMSAAVFMFAACDDDGDSGNNTNNSGNDAVEICDDSTDNDGNGLMDCEDPSCKDDPACEINGIEICDDDKDNDGDGAVDCDDSDCSKNVICMMDGAVGSPCRDASDCTEGVDTVCANEPESGFPAGYCYSSCNTQSDCPEGSVCMQTMFGGYCLKGCDPNGDGSECRPGYSCQDMAGDGSIYACWPACTDDSQCVITGDCAVGDEYGENYTGYCYAPPENCSDGVDNDFDSDADCDDDDCAGDAACGCPEDSLGNTTMDTAGEVTAVPYDVDANICGPSYEDWYLFIAPESTMYQAQISFTHNDDNGDLDLYVYDASNTDEALDSSVSFSNVETVRWNATQGKGYYVVVHGYYKSIGAYHFNLDVAPATPDLTNVTVDPTPLEPGSTAEVSFTIENVGGTAGSFDVVVSADATQYVTLSQSTFSTGELNPGEDFQSTFQLSLADTYASADPIHLNVEVTDSNTSEHWKFDIDLKVLNSVIEAGQFSLTEGSGGNGNGYPDAGETADLSFGLRNTGNADAGALNVQVSTSVSGVNITPSGSTQCTASLAAGSKTTCTGWTISLDSGLSETEIPLHFTVTSDSRTWEYDWMFHVGERDFMPVSSTPDAQGDNGQGVCDLENILFYASSDGLLHFRMKFYSECDHSGLVNDIYVCDTNYDTCITLTYEPDDQGNMITSIYSSSSNWGKVNNPASYVVETDGASSDHVDYTIAADEIPEVDIFTNRIVTSAAVGIIESGNLNYFDSFPEDGEYYFPVMW